MVVKDFKTGSHTSGLVQPHPRLAAFLAFVVVGATAFLIYSPTKSLLVKNWFVTSIAAGLLLLGLFWALPKWAPRINCYLWTAKRSVSITYSTSVALVAFFLAILVCVVLFYIGQWRFPNITQDWRALWSIGLFSGFVPLLIVIYVGLAQAGATKLFKWLDAGRLLLTASQDRFNDRGRVFILMIAAIEIAMIQGGMILTGGLSVTPFNVLLVLAGSVAAMASERPVYAIFVVILSCHVAVATEVVGSYPPPAHDFYPAAHIVVLLLSMAVGLLIDLGRKFRPDHSVVASPGTKSQSL